VRQLAADHHPQQQRVGVLVSASAPQRCTDGFLRQLRGLADELGLPVSTHVQETRLQVVTGQLRHGCTLIEHLDQLGFLKPATSLIHAVWLNPREVTALARSGATAQHNPWSNLMLGSGVQPVRELLDGGVNVSLGSDGSCSTASTSMLNVLGSPAGARGLRRLNSKAAGSRPLGPASTRPISPLEKPWRSCQGSALPAWCMVALWPATPTTCGRFP
jgi:5-methylthioadenosine/S-adenosylhomocysteine deaminase